MEFNVLTTTLSNFLNAFSAGATRIAPYVNGLLYFLGGIEIALLGFWVALGGGDHLTHLMKRFLYLSFWIWLVANFQSLAHDFCNSLIQAGLIAGGQPGNQALLLDPSRIASYGLKATEPLVQAIEDVGAFDIADALVFSLAYIGIMASFLIMAVQVFLAVLEFYLIVPLASILMPFGILGPTKFLAEKGIGGIVGASVKLMVLSFIIAIVEPTLANIRFAGPEIKMNELFAMLLTSGGIMFLTWNAPSLISGLLSGSPSLSASGAAQNVAAGTMLAAGAATAAVGATRAAASVAGSVASGTARAAGTLSTGYALGAAAAGGGPAGTLGGVMGAGRAAGASLVQSATSVVSRGAQSLSSSFSAGSQAALGSGGGNSGGSPPPPPAAAAGPSSAAETAPPSPPAGKGGSAPPSSSNAAVAPPPAWASRALEDLVRTGDDPTIRSASLPN